jgi:hypothetical protein
MTTTLNQIQSLNLDKGQFLNLMSYQAKTTPDDVEFSVKEVLNATNLKFTLQTIEALNWNTETATHESLEQEFDFLASVWDLWKEKFSKDECLTLFEKVTDGTASTSTYKAVFQGLNLIEDRFERQQTENIIAEKFLQHFKS